MPFYWPEQDTARMQEGNGHHFLMERVAKSRCRALDSGRGVELGPLFAVGLRQVEARAGRA